MKYIGTVFSGFNYWITEIDLIFRIKYSSAGVFS